MSSAGPAAPVDESFSSFYAEVKEIEKRDSVFTPKQQIDRLLRPGSTYFNLNPFEVLQVEPETPIPDVMKTYKKFCILVHPDKNQDDADRAKKAFDIITKAWKTLENEDTRQRCLDIIEEAKGRTDLMVEEKRKKLKKDGKPTAIPEDDPAKYKHAIYVLTMKLFADLERKRQVNEVKDMEQRKRKREAEIEEEENSKLQKEWAKNFEESRQTRVESWKTFQAGASKEKKKKKKPSEFRPPKPKPESR